ncbi:MAG: leucine-rich repeat domain-containing protein [Promethearchaeota archaeon]
MNENIVPFRGTELVKAEVNVVLEFEKILGYQFLIVDEITWKTFELRKLIIKAESYLYDKSHEVDFVWQLAISNNNVVGMGLYVNRMANLPSFISEFKSLKYLVLNAGALENIPESIGNLHSLKVLNLGNNQIKKLPSTIGNLKSLEILDLSQNHIEELPDSIGNLNSLITLRLGNNQIKTIPESFKNLKTLDELHLNSNFLQKLPDPIKDLISLRTLYVVNSKLKELPDWIGDLNSLELLVITDNELSFIPESIGNLNSLKTLLLNNNNLTNLPESILNLNSLKLLNINGNNIENLSKFFVPLKRKGVSVVTSAEEVSIDWDLNNRIKINEILKKGSSLILTRNYNEAMNNFEIATELAEKLSDFNHKLHYKSAILNLTGRVYILQGNYHKSLETALEMLKYVELKNDLPGKAIVYNNIGNAYHGMGKSKEALKYYKMGLKILKTQGLENSPDALTIKNSINKLKKKIK